MTEAQGSAQAEARAQNFVLLVLAFVGIYIAGVLTFAYFVHATPPCSIPSPGEISGCAKVESDPSSLFHGIPVAAFGLFAYATTALIAIVRATMRTPFWLVWGLVLLSGSGTGISVYLTRFAATALGTTCIWCLSSAVTMTLLFAVSLLTVRKGPIALVPKLIDGFGAFVLAAVAGGAVWLTATRTFKAEVTKINLAEFVKTSESELDPPDAHVLGNPANKVKIVEFADLGCPTCRMMHQSMKIFLSQHPNVQLVYRNFPLRKLPGHEHSYDAAVLAEESGSGQFWNVVDKFYSLTGELTKEGFDQISKTMLTRPVSEQAAKKTVDRDMSLADRLGIRQTPTYLILVPGSRVAATSADLLSKLNEPKIRSVIMEN